MSASAAFAQTSEFTYQGRFTDSGSPADSFFDFEFHLFDLATGGSLVGAIQRLNVHVSKGVFTVTLDFGEAGFRSSPRFLEIGVKPAGSADPFTTLSPRQPITSAPFAIRSLSAYTSDTANFATNAQNATTATTATTATNANQLGGVAASQYVVTTDPRLSDARPPTAGSASYIQNTTAQQAASNFNISGNGTANLFNAATFYNIAGLRVLSIAGTNKIFASVGAGAGNTRGNFSAFFDASSGAANSIGFSNSFFGSNAGLSNTGGNTNAFFGTTAGQSNTTGSSNAFFGAAAGFSNTSGGNNALFGRSAGAVNTTGAGKRQRHASAILLLSINSRMTCPLDFEPAF